MNISGSTDFKWRGDEAKIAGKKVVGKSAFETGIEIEGQAALLSPFDTGRLRGSITVQTATQQHTNEFRGKAQPEDIISKPYEPNVALVGTNCFYGPYQEYGVHGRPGQAFMRPALDLARGQTLTILRKNGKAYFKDYME